MSSTDLKLKDCGSLPEPGPAGRLVRFFFGGLCFYYIYGLWHIRHDMMTGGETIRPLVWNGIIVGLVLVSYVINIGYSRAWKKWPAVISGAVMLSAAAFGYLQTGSFETPFLARVIQVWEIYIFSHLGLAFLLVAILATPGCEMRAFHHLYSRMTGRPTKEHHCPIGPLGAIDRWEQGRR